MVLKLDTAEFPPAIEETETTSETLVENPLVEKEITKEKNPEKVIKETLFKIKQKLESTIKPLNEQISEEILSMIKYSESAKRDAFIEFRANLLAKQQSTTILGNPWNEVADQELIFKVKEGSTKRIVETIRYLTLENKDIKEELKVEINTLDNALERLIEEGDPYILFNNEIYKEDFDN